MPGNRYLQCDGVGEESVLDVDGRLTFAGWVILLSVLKEGGIEKGWRKFLKKDGGGDMWEKGRVP